MFADPKKMRDVKRNCLRAERVESPRTWWTMRSWSSEGRVRRVGFGWRFKSEKVDSRVIVV